MRPSLHRDAVRAYTAKDDQALRDGVAKGLTAGEIAQSIGRSFASVKRRAAALKVSFRHSVYKDPLYKKLRYANGLDRATALAVLKSGGGQ